MPHEPEYVKNSVERWRAICNCKSASDWMTRQEAEDWVLAHLRLAEQAMVHLRSRNPSLTDQYNYYSQMADDPANPPGDRTLWRQLALGLKPRLPHTPPSKNGEEALPFEVKYTPRRRRGADQP
jgi:hypothetical protein